MIFSGTPLSAVVVRVDVGSKVIDLTLRRPAHPKVKSASSNGSMLLRGIVVGATVPCKITRVIPGAALLVSLAPHTQGRISIIDISDQLLADPFAAFSVGDVIDALVTEIEGSDSPVVSFVLFLSLVHGVFPFLRFVRFILLAVNPKFFPPRCRTSQHAPT